VAFQGRVAEFDEMNMPVEDLATIKELMANADMAGIYVQCSKKQWTCRAWSKAQSQCYRTAENADPGGRRCEFLDRR
jgi:hypothetical protein